MTLRLLFSAVREDDSPGASRHVGSRAPSHAVCQAAFPRDRGDDRSWCRPSSTPASRQQTWASPLARAMFAGDCLPATVNRSDPRRRRSGEENGFEEVRSSRCVVFFSLGSRGPSGGVCNSFDTTKGVRAFERRCLAISREVRQAVACGMSWCGILARECLICCPCLVAFAPRPRRRAICRRRRAGSRPPRRNDRGRRSRQGWRAGVGLGSRSDAHRSVRSGAARRMFARDSYQPRRTRRRHVACTCSTLVFLCSPERPSANPGIRHGSSRGACIEDRLSATR